MGAIQGSSVQTASLDSVTASMSVVPTGGSIAKGQAQFNNAGLFTVAGGAVVYNCFFGGEDNSGTNAGAAVSGMWGASTSVPVVWTPSGTGSNGGSYNIAAVTLANSLTGNELVAVSWTAGGVTYVVYDGVLSSVSGTGFTVTFPGGQEVLPVTGTTVLISTNIDANMTFNASYVDQLLVTSTQPAQVILYDSTPTLRYAGAGITAIGSVQSPNILTAGNYFGVANATPTVLVAYTIAVARFYNLSTTLAIASAVALIN